jgi:phage gp29-like protein
MTTEIDPHKPADQKMMVKYQGGGSDTVYALGIIGAWVYYIKRATTGQEKVMGFLKGLVWPAFLVYELFEFLHKE